jgi:hypothetical protein
MPSGNATFTYTGDEPSVEVSGQTFVQGEATTVTDNGVIAMVSERDDFAEGADEPKPKKAAAKK